MKGTTKIITCSDQCALEESIQKCLPKFWYYNNKCYLDMLAKIKIPEDHLSYTLESLDKNSALFSHTNVP